jgi:hypothetical protein
VSVGLIVLLLLHRNALQAHHDIITGTMPVTVDEACFFAATQLQFELGDYDPFKDISQYLYAPPSAWLA